MNQSSSIEFEIPTNLSQEKLDLVRTIAQSGRDAIFAYYCLVKYGNLNLFLESEKVFASN